MITIEEARKLAEDSRKAPFKIVRAEVEKISGLIKKASERGVNNIYVKINSIHYPFTVMNVIKSYGYKVELAPYEGITLFRISWWE